VKDCELIRVKLLGKNVRWYVLGQSFGGFCLLHYLSVAPEGLKGALFVGGLPSLVTRSPDSVYRLTYKKLYEYCRFYYQKFPMDILRVVKIVAHLSENRVTLPSGGILTARYTLKVVVVVGLEHFYFLSSIGTLIYIVYRRFLQIGIGLGLGNFEKIHFLIESAFDIDTIDNRNERDYGLSESSNPFRSFENIKMSFSFLRGVENMLDFETNPLYVILHEAIYCQEDSSSWSAQRILCEFPEFSLDKDLLSSSDHFEHPIPFLGEMIFEWMFDDYVYLQPLKEAAILLSKKKDWPQLYNLERLRNNQVPCACIIYYHDMYVPLELSEETAKHIGNLRTWITSEYNHGSLHSFGDIILHRLLQLARGELHDLS